MELMRKSVIAFLITLSRRILTMSALFWIELVIMLACIFIGARFNGVGLGIWGGVGLFILSVLNWYGNLGHLLEKKYDHTRIYTTGCL